MKMKNGKFPLVGVLYYLFILLAPFVLQLTVLVRYDSKTIHQWNDIDTGIKGTDADIFGKHIWYVPFMSGKWTFFK